MAKLPPIKNPTADAIFKRHVKDAEDWRRLHLGASLIGSSCSRYLWHSFRWVSPPNFPGRMLRLFERGDREEEWIVSELRSVGMKVEDRDESQPVDPETGKHPQFRQSWIGGHFGGGCDGKVLGVFEAPKTEHVLEVKTSNRKRFDELRKKGVKASNPRHFAQMQVYMHGFGLTRALYVVVNKDTDDIHTERVKYDKGEAEKFIRLAEIVVFARTPLSRVSEDPSWYECKFCEQRPVCHLGQYENLERNCRTCASSTPKKDGSWTCDYHKKTLDGDEQRRGCDAHLFIPELLPEWAPVDYNEEDRAVFYKKPGGKMARDFGGELEEVMSWPDT